MFSNPINAYKQIDLESNVRGADPHYLIVLLFDGADVALNQALIQLSEGNLHAKSISLVKAISIIQDGLDASLNLEAGGDLGHNLHALYDYMVRRLIHANVHKDEGAIREVQGLLSEIGSAWREMGQQLKPQPIANT